MVKIKVTVHAHGFPLNNPYAMTNETIPTAIMTPLSTPMKTSSTMVVGSTPAKPTNKLKNEPNDIARIPEITTSIAMIVTPVGLTEVDMMYSVECVVINNSFYHKFILLFLRLVYLKLKFFLIL